MDTLTHQVKFLSDITKETHGRYVFAREIKCDFCKCFHAPDATIAVYLLTPFEIDAIWMCTDCSLLFESNPPACALEVKRIIGAIN